MYMSETQILWFIMRENRDSNEATNSYFIHFGCVNLDANICCADEQRIPEIVQPFCYYPYQIVEAPKKCIYQIYSVPMLGALNPVTYVKCKPIR